jgi:hypothetical protein
VLQKQGIFRGIDEFDDVSHLDGPPRERLQGYVGLGLVEQS